MARRRFHPLLVWLSLIWFGLTNSVFAGGMMVCNDGHGGSQLEWGGCERNSDGECVISCAGESDGDSDFPHPCQDTPIPSPEQAAQAQPRFLGDTVVPILTVIAVLALWVDAPLVTQVAWISAPEHPPDVIGHIRTVVLLV